MEPGSGIPIDPPEDAAAWWGLERARLLELLGGLAPAEWARPTPCPGWSVLDLSTHLLGVDFGVLGRGRDKHEGMPFDDELGEDAFIAWLDRLQDDWVNACRRLSPRLAVDLLAWTGPQVEAALAARDPRALTGSVSWASADPVPEWLNQVREVSEGWIHRQQLLQALDRDSDLRADLAGPVLDGLRWAYPYRLTRAGAGSMGDRAVVEVVGPVAVRWELVAGESGWRFAGPIVAPAYPPAPASPSAPPPARLPAPPPARLPAPPPPSATLTLSSEQAWRLLTNNLPGSEQAGLDAVGDPGVLEILLRARAIIGAPK